MYLEPQGLVIIEVPTVTWRPRQGVERSGAMNAVQT